jgi:phosphoribosylglycinamide formyltransferase-1
MSDDRVRAAVLASGRGTNLEAIIRAAEGGALGARLVLVLSDKAQAQALERARLHGIAADRIDPKDYASRPEYDAAVAERLKQAGVDLVILAGYMRIVTSALIEPFKHRILNIHPSLLPAFPGMHAPRQALAAGVKVSGCTVHFVDETLDQGPIVLQAAVPVFDGDTEETLTARIREQEHRILPEAIRLFAHGRLRIDGRCVRIQATAAEALERATPAAGGNR